MLLSIPKNHYLLSYEMFFALYVDFYLDEKMQNTI